jgi:hypothetical protein
MKEPKPTLRTQTSWVAEWFTRRGRGVLAVIAGRILAMGTHSAPPTASIDFVGGVIHVAGGAGVEDSLQVCLKDAADAYGWETIGVPSGVYTNEMAQDAVGGILTDSASIDFTYNDGANTITAAVLPGGISHTAIADIGTNTHAQIDTHIAAANPHSGSQPLDADLTTLAANITAFGHSLVDDANAAAAIATLGLDADIATLALPASTTITAAGAALIDDASAADQRTTLGLVAGGAGDIWVEKGGDTMTGDLIVPDEAYDATAWNGSLEVPTKNAIRDKIEAGIPATAGGSDTQVQFNDGGTALGGDAGLTYNKTSDLLTLTGSATVDTAADYAIVSLDGALGGSLDFYDDGVLLGAVYADSTGVQIYDDSAARSTIISAGATVEFTVGANINSFGDDLDTKIQGDTDTNLLYVDAGADSVAIGNAAPTSWFDLKAGTTARAPLRIPSGTSLTTPIAGVAEYDGSSLYWTNNTTSDRGVVPAYHEFLLEADGSAISTIADFFGATSSIDLPATSNWLLEADLFFLKTTNGTIVLTITNSAANYTGISGWYVVDAAAGLGTQAAPAKAGISEVTTAAAAFPATASLTNGTTHHMQVRAVIRMNAAGNIRLRFTASAGSATPQSNSWYSIRRLPGNTGAFVA